MLPSLVRSAAVLGVALGLAFASVACDGGAGIPFAPSAVGGAPLASGSTPGLRGPVVSPFLPTVSPADEICDSEKPGSPGALADAQLGILENEFAPTTELEIPCFQLEHN